MPIETRHPLLNGYLALPLSVALLMGLGVPWLESAALVLLLLQLLFGAFVALMFLHCGRGLIGYNLVHFSRWRFDGFVVRRDTLMRMLFVAGLLH